jgi:hypothetical protein
MRWMPFAALIAAASFATASTAQVHKCKDAAGKTIYTDAPCTTGTVGGMIQRERTIEEKMQEREEAYNAELRKQYRRLAEQEREWAEQQQRAMQPQATPSVRQSGNSWSEQNARRNAEVSASSITNNGGRWDKTAGARRTKERREEVRQETLASPEQSYIPPPTNITNCGGGFCHDNQGGVYNQVSPDFMTSPSGRPCHRAGTMWNCN